MGRTRTAVAARRLGRGTVLRFRSSEAGTASIAFSRVVRGKRGRTRARAAGRLTRRIAAGPARIALSGRVGRRAMRVGRYRLTLQVRDAAGNASRPVRLRFRIARVAPPCAKLFSKSAQVFAEAPVSEGEFPQGY